MDFLSEWTAIIIAITLLFAVIEMILPDGEQKKYLLMIFGILSGMTIATPVIELVTKDFKIEEVLNIDEYIDEAKAKVNGAEKINENVENIEREFEAQIVRDFNNQNENIKLTNARVTFNKDIEGKIIDIARIVVYTKSQDISVKQKTATLCEVTKDKVEVICQKEG